MRYRWLPQSLAVVLTLAAEAGAVASAELPASAELYTSQTYTYGRFEARVQFAAGDGVISSFFLWKPGSQVPGTYWNELDFEKLGADCRLHTNTLYGLPFVDRSESEPIDGDLCGEYHTYTFEWTPTYIAYLVDGVEVRRDGQEAATAFAENAASGMEIHFNIWPGDASFGGNFDAAILPVQQFISWVQYSSFSDGAFTLEWREEFDGPTLPSGWLVGDWESPKILSTHQPANVELSGGFGVLSLTADDATGFAGTPPPDPGAGEPPDPSAGGDAGASGAAGLPPIGEIDGEMGSTGGAAGTGGGSSTSPTPRDAPTGAPPTGVAGASAAPSNLQQPAARDDGGCSQVMGASARPWSATAFGIGTAILAACRRRGRRLEKRRPGHRGSMP